MKQYYDARGPENGISKSRNDARRKRVWGPDRHCNRSHKGAGLQRLHQHEILILCDDTCTHLPNAIPNRAIRNCYHAQIADVARVGALRPQPMRQCRRRISHRPEISRLGDRENRMIGSPRREFKRCRNVLILQIRIVAKNFLPRRSSGQHLKDVLHAHPQSTDTRTPAAGLRIGRDTRRNLRHHLLQYLHRDRQSRSSDLGRRCLPDTCASGAPCTARDTEQCAGAYRAQRPPATPPSLPSRPRPAVPHHPPARAKSDPSRS